MLRNGRGRDSERPAHHNEEWPPLAATRESPPTETKTQHNQKKKKKKKKKKIIYYFPVPQIVEEKIDFIAPWKAKDSLQIRHMLRYYQNKNKILNIKLVLIAILLSLRPV